MSALNYRRYLDYNATTPVRPEVMDAVLEVFGLVGNPSSVHGEGRRARSLVEHARERVAKLIGAEADDVVFTSGGTEANNLALSPRIAAAFCGSVDVEKASANAVCFVSAIEHASVLQGGRFNAGQVRRLPVTADGVVDVAAARPLLEAAGDTGLPFMVSVMLANNETGAIQPVAEISKIVREQGGVMHTDAVQASGRTRVDITKLGADLVSLSAHKIGGPHGTGALAGPAVDYVIADPMFNGGGQERRRRAGTENLSGVIGFGIAAEIARKELTEMSRIGDLRDLLEAGVKELAPETRIFSEDTVRLPNTSCLGVPGMQAQTTLIALDLAGVAVSSGAACSSGKVERSHVLTAMGAGDELSDCALRISLGWASGEEDIERFLSEWAGIYENHRSRLTAA